LECGAWEIFEGLGGLTGSGRRMILGAPYRVLWEM
jgi:hypothetical protein